ncbi:serine/arginine repetitive matrix protein 1-like isoform X2 [Aedes albopictus]|uniref:Uncharacterized protein n=1 Tax=Aedes albopictus TaxID=7160 RepID=A0ABM1ZCT7_AEDAL
MFYESDQTSVDFDSPVRRPPDPSKHRTPRGPFPDCPSDSGSPSPSASPSRYRSSRRPVPDPSKHRTPRGPVPDCPSDSGSPSPSVSRSRYRASHRPVPDPSKHRTPRGPVPDCPSDSGSASPSASPSRYRASRRPVPGSPSDSGSPSPSVSPSRYRSSRSVPDHPPDSGTPSVQGPVSPSRDRSSHRPVAEYPPSTRRRLVRRTSSIRKPGSNKRGLSRNCGSTVHYNGAKAPKKMVRISMKKRMRKLEAALNTQRKISVALATKLNSSKSAKKVGRCSNVSNSDEFIDIMHSTANEIANSRDQGESSLYSCMNNMSIASLNVPECKSSDGEDDIDKKTFQKWKDLLETSMQLVGISDELTKMRIFRIKAGSKLLDILDSTTSTPENPNAESHPYSNAIARLTNSFGSRDHCLMQRQKLRSISQNAGETDLKFVKRVVAAAKLCDFGDEQLLENVAFVIQSHADNFKVREASRKVLRKGGSLAALLEKVQAFEMEKFNEEIYLKNRKKSVDSEIAAVSYEHSTENGSQIIKSDSSRNGYFISFFFIYTKH